MEIDVFNHIAFNVLDCVSNNHTYSTIKIYSASLSINVILTLINKIKLVIKYHIDVHKNTV